MTGIVLHPGQTVAAAQGPLTAFYDLRWRFDYANRPSAFGRWSAPSRDPALQAWNKNREGLVRAAVEGKNRLDPEDVRALAECDGHAFVNFQWVAAASVAVAAIGKARPRHMLLGMRLLTRDFDFLVTPDGKVEGRLRSAEERQMNFATFGK